MKSALFILITFIKLSLIIFMVVLIIKNLLSDKKNIARKKQAVKYFLITIGALVILTIIEFMIVYL